jgi:hypothetical protein
MRGPDSPLSKIKIMPEIRMNQDDESLTSNAHHEEESKQSLVAKDAEPKSFGHTLLGLSSILNGSRLQETDEHVQCDDRHLINGKLETSNIRSDSSVECGDFVKDETQKVEEPPIGTFGSIMKKLTGPFLKKQITQTKSLDKLTDPKSV